MNKPHKHADIIKAWADGAKVQVKDNVTGDWDDLDCTPSWDLRLQYRVKPEKKEPVIRYLWAFRHKKWTGFDIFARFMDEKQANEWATNNSWVIHRLDWSRTEFPE